MSYIIVDRKPVFLTHRRDEELRAEALREKDAIFRVSSRVAGLPEVKEAHRLVYDTLRTKHHENPSKFEAEWVNFDLVGDEARANTWDLLHDYCGYTGAGGWLSNVRPFEEKLIDDYAGDTLRYPMGRTFLLNFRIRRTWWRSTAMSVTIATDHIVRASGTKAEFVLLGRYFNVYCGSSIDISYSNIHGGDAS